MALREVSNQFIESQYITRTDALGGTLLRYIWLMKGFDLDHLKMVQLFKLYGLKKADAIIVKNTKEIPENWHDRIAARAHRRLIEYQLDKEDKMTFHRISIRRYKGLKKYLMLAYDKVLVALWYRDVKSKYMKEIQISIDKARKEAEAERIINETTDPSRIAWGHKKWKRIDTLHEIYLARANLLRKTLDDTAMKSYNASLDELYADLLIKIAG